MNKFFIKIGVILEYSNASASTIPKKGRGFSMAYKFNWWNPLTYITIVFGFCVAMFKGASAGFMEFKEEVVRFSKWD